jgi:hypothetical protein
MAMAPRNKRTDQKVYVGKGSAAVLDSPPESIGTGGTIIKTTHPDVLLRHNISDEELTVMQKSKSDKAWEMLLAALGAAAGSAPQVVRDLYGAYWARSAPLDGASVISLLIFGGACVSALATWVLSSEHQSEADALAAAIRERTKTSFEVFQGQKEGF